MILSEDYRILRVRAAAELGSGELEGRDLWEAFPGSKPLYHPYYDRARRTREPVEFVQFYGGFLARIRAVPVGAELHLYWERLERIDTLTLEGLRDSLTHALSGLEEQETKLRREQLRGRLHVVEGETS